MTEGCDEDPIRARLVGALNLRCIERRIEGFLRDGQCREGQSGKEMGFERMPEHAAPSADDKVEAVPPQAGQELQLLSRRRLDAACSAQDADLAVLRTELEGTEEPSSGGCGIP